MVHRTDVHRRGYNALAELRGKRLLRQEGFVPEEIDESTLIRV